MNARNVILGTILVIACCSIFVEDVLGARIWTDGNGDGLPDNEPFSAAPNTSVTVGLWIDAEAFNWTNFLAFAEWTPGCVRYDGAAYAITGGSTFPIDDFSNPNGVGFGGIGFNKAGAEHIGDVSLTVLTPVSCCVTPIINPNNPYYTFSQVGAGPLYMLFATMTATCYGEPGPLPGACCFSDGSCAFVTTDECDSAGGAYQGDGTQCASANCPQPTVACCFPDGSCQDETPAICASTGGVSQAAGTSCATVLCPLPTVACCLSNGTCRDWDVTSCLAAGGTSRGPDTNCASTACPQACCFVFGSCADLTPASCASAGGISLGPGTSCATTACPWEACCLPQGSCLDVGRDYCIAAGGVPQGPGTTCATSACPWEACCFWEGTCREMDRDYCIWAGGVPQGEGTKCEDVACPREACCLPYEDCSDLAPEYCRAGGGVPQGPGTSCATITCPLEACCFPQGSRCEDLTPEYCVYQGGTPQGPGTTCETAACPWQACCLPYTCYDVLPTECMRLSGVPQGPGTTCETITCPGLPKGACCLASGACEFIRQRQCVNRGGTFRGPGALCDTTKCPQPPFVGDEGGPKRAASSDAARLGTSGVLVAYPNPTRSQTAVLFRLSAGSGNVDLAVFDAVGRRVANLAAGAFPAGDWSTTWDGRDEATREPAPSGTYFLRLETGTGNITEKITLVR